MTHDFARFLLTISIRSGLVLLFLIAGLRWMGKRQIGQMNVYDLVLVMALANAVQNAMTAGKGDLSVGLVSAGTLLVIGRALTTLFVRRPDVEERLVGTPTLIINDGHLVREHMQREHITEEQVMTALREHELTDPSEAKLAVLEVDGSLSVVPRDAPSSRTRRRFRTLRLP
jgi:uncharacterized membrane protein YcaP (DUF421 family)